jgi:DNA-binding NtrC family response regulator
MVEQVDMENHQERILIVDDEAKIRQLLRRKLSTKRWKNWAAIQLIW